MCVCMCAHSVFMFTRTYTSTLRVCMCARTFPSTPVRRRKHTQKHTHSLTHTHSHTHTISSLDPFLPRPSFTHSSFKSPVL
jgi:hypothetical protein